MAILKDLIVHGSSRFLNKIYASEIQTPLIEAEAGIIKKLKADDVTVVGLLDVKGQLHTNSWSNSNIATIDGSFYITPTIGSDSGTVSITSSSLTFSGTNYAISSLYLGDGSSITWPQYSKVLVTGQVLLNEEWIPLGTLLGQISGTATAASISINNIKDNKNQTSNVYTTLVNSGVSSTNYRNLKISLYQRAAGSTTFYPLGIYMTASGTNGRTFLDIYGGVEALSTSNNYGGFAEPNVRIGNLQGLPNVGGQTPSGWGIYTDNGYFKGIIAADRGYIGTGSKYWVIANYEDGSNPNNSRSYIYNNTDSMSSTAEGIYLGTDGIRNYKDSTHFVTIQNGVINAKGVNLTGQINATAGNIGGASITGGTLTVPAAYISGQLTAATIDASKISTGDISSDRITTNVLTALQAKLTSLNTNNLSAITANLGTITTGVIKHDTIGGTNGIWLSADTDTNSNITVGESTARKDWRLLVNNKFGVTKEGNLYASNVDLTGKITATDGSIGGIDIINGNLDVSSISIGNLGGASNYAQKTDVTNAIDNLQIGGRNLLKDSNTSTYISKNSAIAHLENGADNVPLQSFMVDIEPVQSGTGDPSPTNVRPISGWNGVKVTKTGKNLLDTSVMHSGLLALTVGASEDSVTQSSRYGYSDRIPSTSAMVISARSDDTTNYNWIRVIQYVNGIVVAVIGGFEDIESTKTLAIPARENSYIRVVYGAKPSGAVSTSVIGYTQVELGSTATPYEPYNGVTIWCVENALKPSTAFAETQNGLTFTSDGEGTYSVKGTNTATETVRSAIFPVPSFTIPPSTTHTFYLNNNAINSNVFLSFMNGSTSIDSWAFNALNRTAPNYGTMGNKLCDGIRIVVAAGQTVDITFSPMLVPKENTIYGGTLNPLTGVLMVDTRLLTLSSNGLGNYAYNSSNGQLRITSLKAMPNTIENICSHYKSFNGTFANLPDKSFMASSTTVAVKDTNFTSLEAWLTYLDAQVAANTPVQARVKLQTAEVIQLTPHQIRSLYGQNNIWADTGNVTVNYKTNELIGNASQVIPSGTTITISTQIDANDIIWDTSAAHKRIGVSLSLSKDGGETQYIEAWASSSDENCIGIVERFNTSFHGRIKYTYTLLGDIVLNRPANLYIQGISSGTVTVSNPKIEIGNKGTDWTLALEDTQESINNAAKTATSYITYIDANDGIKIHNAQDTLNYLQLNSAAISMFRDKGDGLGSDEVLRIDDSRIRIGKEEGPHFSLTSDKLMGYGDIGNVYFEVGKGDNTTIQLFYGNGERTSFEIGPLFKTVYYVKKNDVDLISGTDYEIHVTAVRYNIYFKTEPTLNSTISVTYKDFYKSFIYTISSSSSGDITVTSQQGPWGTATVITIQTHKSYEAESIYYKKSGTDYWQRWTLEAEQESGTYKYSFRLGEGINSGDQVKLNYSTEEHTDLTPDTVTENYTWDATHQNSTLLTVSSASQILSVSIDNTVLTEDEDYTLDGLLKYGYLILYNAPATNEKIEMKFLPEEYNFEYQPTYFNFSNTNLENSVKGIGAASFGSENINKGIFCFAEGAGNIVTGYASHVEGHNNIAAGSHSHVGGSNSLALGQNTFAYGDNLQATYLNSAAFGFYNSPENQLFSIGRGGYENAFSINKDGNIQIGGLLLAGTTYSNKKPLFIFDTLVWTGQSIRANGGWTQTGYQLNRKPGYKAIAVAGVGIYNGSGGKWADWCIPMRCYVWSTSPYDLLDVYIWNQYSSATVNTSIYIKILFIADTAL